jgi:hypothetical protein
MAIATPGRVYAHVQRNRCHWKFTSAQLPEWNENQFEAVDVTGNEPNVGDVWNGSVFSPYVPTPEEVAAAALAAADASAKQAAKADALITFLIEKTPAEVVARVNSDITDLASAKQVIAKLAVAVSVLAKSSLR